MSAKPDLSAAAPAKKKGRPPKQKDSYVVVDPVEDDTFKPEKRLNPKCDWSNDKIDYFLQLREVEYGPAWLGTLYNKDKKELWEKIAVKFNMRFQTILVGSQMANRYKYFKKILREHKANDLKTGNNKIPNKPAYWDILLARLSSREGITGVSQGEAEDDMLLSDNGEECNDEEDGEVEDGEEDEEHTDDGQVTVSALSTTQMKSKKESNKRRRDSRSETPSGKKTKLDMPAAVVSLGESIVESFASVDFGGSQDNNKLEEKLEAWAITSDARMAKLDETLTGVNNTMTAFFEYIKKKEL